MSQAEESRKQSFGDRGAEEVLLLLAGALDWQDINSSLSVASVPGTSGDEYEKYTVWQVKPYKSNNDAGAWTVNRLPIALNPCTSRYVYDTREKAKAACQQHYERQEWLPCD